MPARNTILFLSLLVLTACDTDVVDAPVVQLIPTFEPSRPNLGPGEIGLEPGSPFLFASYHILGLSTWSGGVADLHSVSYLLLYDPDLLEYQRSDPGFLSVFGYEDHVYQASLEGPGRVRVVHRRTVGEGTSDAGSLHGFEFLPRRQGTATIDIAELVATDSTGRTIPGISAWGGTVEVVRSSGDRER